MSSSKLNPPLLMPLGLARDVSAQVPAVPVPALEFAAAQLRALNHRLVGALGGPGVGSMDMLTAEDFLYMDGDGNGCSRDDFLCGMGDRMALGGRAVNETHVRLFGPVAVVHGLFTALAGDGSPRRTRTTDVHLWSGAAWALVSAQDTRLKDAVPVPQQTASAPTRPRWQGEDPVGEDPEVLRVLNENYVKAFREADVAWYEAHLALDYVVVSGDGSFHDRAAALANFARPVFATSMKSFPVGDVRIRRFGDVALIHAENDYELKDGRKGVSRYTDIWHKRDHAWRCVAAHITVHRAPA